jgi:hypothetical protein
LAISRSHCSSRAAGSATRLQLVAVGRQGTAVARAPCAALDQQPCRLLVVRRHREAHPAGRLGEHAGVEVERFPQRQADIAPALPAGIDGVAQAPDRGVRLAGQRRDADHGDVRDVRLAGEDEPAPRKVLPEPRLDRPERGRAPGDDNLSIGRRLIARQRGRFDAEVRPQQSPGQHLASRAHIAQVDRHLVDLVGPHRRAHGHHADAVVHDRDRSVDHMGLRQQGRLGEREQRDVVRGDIGGGEPGADRDAGIVHPALADRHGQERRRQRVVDQDRHALPACARCRNDSIGNRG